MNPFMRFRTYEEKDANSFFGRDQDIIGLSSLVKTCPVTVCYSDSGIGKSSLINAGVSPRLKEEQYFPIYLLFDSISERTDFDSIIINALNNSRALNSIWDNGSEEMEASLCKITLSDNVAPALNGSEDEAKGLRFHFECCIPESDEMLQELDKKLKDKSLWWFLRTRELVCRVMGRNIDFQPLLIFDQFEELFDKCADFESCKYFFLWFKGLLSTEAPALVKEKYRELQFAYISEGKATQVLPGKDCIKALFSIRREYIGQLDYWTIQRTDTYMAAFQSNRYFLRPLSAEQAEEVITRRGSDSSLERWKSQILACAKDGNDGYASMILSVVCHELYDHGVDYAPMLEDADDPKVLGNVLLANVYADAIKATSISKRTLEKIEDDLVDEQGKRRRILTDDESYHISKIKNADAIIDNLCSQGIIKRTSDESNQQTRIELVHDRLAQVVVNKRRSVKKFRTIKLIRTYVAIFLVLLATLASIGAWNPGRYFGNSTKHGNYAPAANPYHYRKYRKEWKWSEVGISYKSYDALEHTESLILDEDGSLFCIASEFHNLKTIKTESLSSCIIQICEKCDISSIDINAKKTNVENHGSIKLIHLGKNVEEFNYEEGGLGVSHSTILFDISPENDTFIKDNGIIWNTKTHELVYMPHDMRSKYERYCFPPVNGCDTVYYAANRGGSMITYDAKYGLLTDSVAPIIIGDALSEMPINAKGTIDLSSFSFKEVSSRAFSSCCFIDTIILPTTVESIDTCAFANCAALKHINTKELRKLSNIGNWAFENCISLDTLIIPNNDSISLPADALANCHTLKYLKYPNEISEVNLIVLNTLSNLSVKLPHKVNAIHLPNYSDINYIIDEPSQFHQVCEGLIINDCGKYGDGRIIMNSKWNNFSDSVINVLKEASGNSYVVDKKGRIKYRYDKKSYVLFHPTPKAYRKIGKCSKYYCTSRECLLSIGTEEKCLSLPPGNYREIILTTSAESLKELHINHAEPIELTTFPDHIKQRITLYVPWHCRDNYLLDSRYNAFKEIKEDSLGKRILSIISFYKDDIFGFFGNHPWLFGLLVFFIGLVAFVGVVGIVSILKKRKIAPSVLRKKATLTALTMIILAAVGYVVCYWFCWIVLCDSHNVLLSNVFGVIGGLGVPWLYIFCEEIDSKTFKKTIKSSPAVIKAWLKVLYKRTLHFIAKHWKLLIAAVLITTSAICWIKINRTNGDIRKNLARWESAEKQDKDFVLSALISRNPSAHSFFCPDGLTQAYDSLITAAYDSLIYERRISFADTLLHSDVEAFDYSQKLVYIGSSPMTRFDIKTGHTDTLSYPEKLPNGNRTLGDYCDRANGCVYYLAELSPDSIEIRKIEGDKDHYTDTLVSVLPNDNAIRVSYAELRITEDEKTAVIYSFYNDMIQCWNLERKYKIFERLHVLAKAYCIGNDAFYFFEDWGDTLTYVPLSGDGSAHSILKTKNIYDISVAEDGKLLLTNKDYKGEIGLLDIETKEFKHLLKYYCYYAIMDGGYLYLIRNDRLLRYDLNSTITTASKVEKIKDYLNAFNNQEDKKTN